MNRERCRALVCGIFLSCAEAPRQEISKQRGTCLSLSLEAEVGVGPRPRSLPYKGIQFPRKASNRPPALTEAKPLKLPFNLGGTCSLC